MTAIGKPPYRRGEKSTSSLRVGLSTSGVPMLQANWGGKLYGAPLFQEGAGMEKSTSQLGNLKVEWTALFNSGGSLTKITGSGVSISKGGTEVANFAATTYIGDQSNEHVKISTAGVQIKDGATVRATFSATPIVHNLELTGSLIIN